MSLDPRIATGVTGSPSCTRATRTRGLNRAIAGGRTGGQKANWSCALSRAGARARFPLAIAPAPSRMVLTASRSWSGEISMYRWVVASEECPARCWMTRGCTPRRASSVMNHRRPECELAPTIPARSYMRRKASTTELGERRKPRSRWFWREPTNNGSLPVYVSAGFR